MTSTASTDAAGRSRRRSRGAGRPGLTRDAVVAEALALVDAEGLEALSMRAVARRLAVTPMALYNHVGGRAELADAIADRVASEIRPRPEPSGWRAWLRAWCLAIRGACRAHPNAVALLEATRATTPALVRPSEACLAALADAGFEPGPAREAWSALIALTMGHVRYELGGHMRTPRGPDAAAPPPEERFDFDRAFGFALDALLDGLERRAAGAA